MLPLEFSEEKEKNETSFDIKSYSLSFLHLASLLFVNPNKHLTFGQIKHAGLALIGASLHCDFKWLFLYDV